MNASDWRFRLLLPAGLLFALWWVPSLASTYYTELAIEVVILALYAISCNLILGYGGMLSLGHAAFFGVGAYTVALLVKKAGFASFFGTLGAAMVAAGLLAVVIGFFSVRLSQTYLTMLTLAFAQMVHALASRWYSLTNGDTGITGLPRVVIGGLDYSDPEDFYRLALLVVGVAVWLLWRVVESPFGLALRTVRDNPKRAAFLGLPVNRHRLAAFVIAGIFAGLAGALFAWYQRAAFPGFVHWSKSAEAVTVTILGGHAYFLGPVVGAVAMLFLETYVRRLTEYWSLVLGVILIALVFFPSGLTGAADRLYRRLRERRAARGAVVRA